MLKNDGEKEIATILQIDNTKMDLLFNNPRYFFEVYFDVLWWKFLLAFVSILLIGFFINYLLHNRIDKQRIIMIVLFSLYMTTVFSATLLGENRIGNRGINLNIVENITNIFVLKNVHAVREFCSNIILFLPFVSLIAVAFSVSSHKIVVLIGVALSVLIEITQYVLSVGFTQINDILANTIGLFAGLLIIKVIHTVANKRGLK